MDATAAPVTRSNAGERLGAGEDVDVGEVSDSGVRRREVDGGTEVLRQYGLDRVAEDSDRVGIRA